MNETINRSHFTPEGWHTVTPRIVVHDTEQLVEFLRQVFAATGQYRPDRPSVIMIGDAMVMVSDAGIRNPTPAFLYVYVDDTDKTYTRALQAGATSLEEPSDMPYGDRRGMVKDKWGNTWQIATHIGDREHYMTENKRTVKEYLDGFSKSDHKQILSCLTEDVEWEMPGEFHLVGKKAFDKEIENAAFVGSPDITILRIVEENNIVIAEGKVGVKKKDGGFLNAQFCDVFVMTNGKIKRLTTYLAEVN